MELLSHVISTILEGSLIFGLIIIIIILLLKLRMEMLKTLKMFAEVCLLKQNYNKKDNFAMFTIVYSLCCKVL